MERFPSYQTTLGIYSPRCGLDKVHMSWGHDEYLYQVVKDYLPPEAGFIIRYHSFYSAHREGAYSYLMNEHDEKLLPWLQLFYRFTTSTQNKDAWISTPSALLQGTRRRVFC